MGFFDLNIPYYESDRQVTDKSTLKSNRLKLIIKAAELGYTSVAYNRLIRGVMSESDRCSTSLLPLSSLLNLAPSISSSVKFHRRLLNVPVSTPFRQYTRLTVVIDSPAQAAALNSGNPVLKSYDIVAVRPMNQNAFEEACQNSKVDIIAIDFLDKLPFRLNQSTVEAAVKRGVYFEITYSSLIVDAQVRRQMISHAKLLVDWTRGKNLLVSSAAPSVSELRGPYDVANLSSLLGLPFEHAKAAISKNCRSVIANALRKKHYKEATKVEVLPSSGKVNSEELVFSDWLKWDPISSGEGDLMLDDIEKSFSASSSVSNTVKTVKFASALNSLPSHGLHIKETLSTAKSAPETLDNGKNLSFAEDTKVAVAVNGMSGELYGPNLLPEEGQTSMETRHQGASHQDIEVSIFPTSTVNDSTQLEQNVKHLVSVAEVRSSKELDASFPSSGGELHNLQSQSCLGSCDDHVLLPDAVTNDICTNDADASHTYDDIASTEIYTHSKDTVSAFSGEESKIPISSTVDVCVENLLVEEDKIGTGHENEKDQSMLFSDVSEEGFRGSKQFQEYSENIVTLADEFPIVESHNQIEQENECLVSEVEQIQEDVMVEQREMKDQVTMQCQILGESVSGRVKRRRVHHHFPFPLKHNLNLRPFKKKIRKLHPI